MKKRGWVFLLLGGLAGGLLLTPAGAHVNDSFAHLWDDHIQPQVHRHYAIRCTPSNEGVIPYAGACFDNGTYTATTWRAASRRCGDLENGRLPTLSELEGLRTQDQFETDLGTSTQPYELSSEYAGFENGPGNQAYALEDDGGFMKVPFSQDAPFRCVRELTQRRYD